MPKVKGFKGVTFSQFDNHVGPRLIYSYPPNVLSQEEFESLSDYAIVGKHLCEKILAIKANNIQFLNYSIAIENTKYERNTILFSFGFVLEEDVDPDPFTEVLKKVASTFVTLELECEFLFQEATRSQLPRVLEILYNQLNTKGEVFIAIDDSNILAARLFLPITTPREILDHEVPVLLVESELLATMNWDITIRHIIQYIDGNNSAIEISNSYPGMDLEIVKRALQILLYYKCILVADKVKFSNIYELTRLGQEVIEIQYVFSSLPDDTPAVKIPSVDEYGNSNLIDEYHYKNDDDHDSDAVTEHDEGDRNVHSNTANSLPPLTLDCYHPTLVDMLMFASINNWLAAVDTQNTHSDSAGATLTQPRDIPQYRTNPTPNRNRTYTKQSIDTYTVGPSANVSDVDTGATALAAGVDSVVNPDELQDITLLNQLVHLLSCFQPNTNLASIILLCQKYTAGLNVRRLVTYAQHYGLIRRIHEYPVDTGNGRTRGTVVVINPNCSTNHGIFTDSNISGTANVTKPSDPTHSSRSNNSSLSFNTANASSATPWQQQHHPYRHTSAEHHVHHPPAGNSNPKSIYSSIFATHTASTTMASSTFIRQPAMVNKVKPNTSVTLFLDGTECLDAICCKYSIPTRTILSIPGVIVIYK